MILALCFLYIYPTVFTTFVAKLQALQKTILKKPLNLARIYYKINGLKVYTTMIQLKKILLVENEPDTIKITAFRLARAGYEVVIAENGLIALEKLRTAKPDIVILDMDLPVVNGYEVCKKIKADENLKSIPVVALVSNGNKMLEDLSIEHYLSKPYEQDTLINKINSTIK
ncbi:response regulator [Elusimicrobiota bacterium]